VLPVSEKFADYGAEVRGALAAAGIRADLDERSEKLGYKIRQAQVEKVPYMLVVGAREAESGAVAVRLRTGEDLGAMSLDDIVERITAIVGRRSREL